MWLGLVMGTYVDIFDAVHVYLFHQWFDSKMPCQSITFSSNHLFDAAAYRCIAVLCISSAFQDDGFLGIFFPIQLCILDFSLLEWLAA